MEIGKKEMTVTKRVCTGCKNIFVKSSSVKRIYGVIKWDKKTLVMCKKCLLKDQKESPNEWEYGKFLWNSLSDIEKLFYITSRSEEEAEENQLEVVKLGNQKWEEIEMLHQWLLMCTINKFGPPYIEFAAIIGAIATIAGIDTLVKNTGKAIIPKISSKIKSK